MFNQNLKIMKKLNEMHEKKEMHEKFDIEELEKRLEMTQTFDLPSGGEDEISKLSEDDGWEIEGPGGTQPAPW